MSAFSRRGLVRLLAAGAASWSLPARAQQNYQPPRTGRYRVYRHTYNLQSWIRDLVIESASNYAVYELNNGPLYGRGTYRFDGSIVKFLTGPFYELGYSGSSYVRPDGKHYLRLGNTVEAISEK